MGRLNLERSRKSSKMVKRGHNAIADLSTSKRIRPCKPVQKGKIVKSKTVKSKIKNKKAENIKIVKNKTVKSTTKKCKVEKSRVEKKKPRLIQKKIPVKKIPPISQKRSKLLKRNEVVVFEYTEYKWTGSLWVNIKDNIVAPQYTAARLNMIYPDRENIQKTDTVNPPKKAEQL
jgi:hypothetical protein